MPTVKPEPCGCYVRKGVLDIECEFHKQKRVQIQSRTAQYLAAKVSAIFGETHLRELEERVLNEIHAVQNAP